MNDDPATHCPTCYCGRRAPVQGSVSSRTGRAKKAAGSVSWAEHLEAYESYSAHYGTQQSAEHLAERAGFGYWEITDLLGHEPTTWLPIAAPRRSSELRSTP